MRKTAAILGVLAAALLLAAVSARAQAQQAPNEWDTVRDAIERKRARWTARRNSMHRFSRRERRRRLGALSTPPAKTPYLAPAEKPLLGSGAALDWRNNNGVNAVTPVKDQGACGSCWAFSTTAGLESQLMMMGGEVPDAAEQVLLSCSGAGSCAGGWPADASRFLKSTGLPPESSFPYSGADESCQAAVAGWQQSAAKIGSFWTIAATVPALKTALAAYGPVSTTFDVYTDFWSYSSGVYSYTSGEFEGAHAVLIIGYDDAEQAFIAKNSWGTGWGEQGFFRIAYSEVNGMSHFGRQTIAYSMPCYYLTNPPVAMIGRKGGVGRFTVKPSGPACPPWTVASDSPWLKVVSGGRGRKDGSVVYSASANPGGMRGGQLLITAVTADPGRRGSLRIRGSDSETPQPVAPESPTVTPPDDSSPPSNGVFTVTQNGGAAAE